jgi:ribosome-associated translation inhibitor RaiA
MKIQTAFIHIDHSDSLEQYVVEHSEKLDKYFKTGLEYQWTFSKKDHKKEIKCHVVGDRLNHPFKVYCDNWQTGSQKVINKINTYLSKEHRKRKDHIHKKS